MKFPTIIKCVDCKMKIIIIYICAYILNYIISAGLKMYTIQCNVKKIPDTNNLRFGVKKEENVEQKKSVLSVLLTRDIQSRFKIVGPIKKYV